MTILILREVVARGYFCEIYPKDKIFREREYFENIFPHATNKVRVGTESAAGMWWTKLDERIAGWFIIDREIVRRERFRH